MISNPICNLCGFADFKTLQTQRDADVYLGLVGIDESSMVREWRKCVSCGHIYNSAQLDSTEIKKLYDEFRNQEWRNETPDQYFDRITSLGASESENSAKAKLLLDHLSDDTLPRGGSLIDIGCGGGVLIHTLQNCFPGNWEFYGVEPTTSFADLAARRTKADIRSVMYESGLFPNCQFEVATCCQVLEHLSEPRGFLAHVHQDLVRDGWLYLEVPDISDFSSLPSNHDRFMIQHVSYFSESVLRNLLESSSFVLRHVGVTRTVRERNNLWCLAQAA